jgi:Tol biopolymer transport system component
MNRFALILLTGLAFAAGSDQFGKWTHDVRVRPVAAGAQRHSIHTYFNVSPESPDGRWILFYTSTTPDGHHGEVRIRERATGKEKVLASKIYTEDAHRAACQQWISNGRRVVFHNEVNGEWQVIAVDVATGKQRILARNHMLSWGRPEGDIVPLYKPHWAPGDHPDLVFLNVETGELKTVLTAKATRAAYGPQIAQRFGDKPISLFFPILSPDGKRMVFKLATATGNDPRSKTASDRECLIGYDLEKSRFLFFRAKWGHPAWHPDSRTLINVPNVLEDSNTGASRPIPNMPKFPGSHPSISPDGRLFATDTTLEAFGGKKEEWGVVVGDLEGQHYRILHRFNNSNGAKSWRVSHPHPMFSPDDQRLYFNVSEGKWTELYVAEIGASGAGTDRD